MRMIFEVITPERADDLLKNHNPSNRRLNERHVAFLVQEMERGTFRPDNGDTIRIDTNGNVLDGQHRLAMIARINKPVEMAVAYDVDPEAFATVDIGKRRSVQDIVGIDMAQRGIHMPTGAATSARLLLEYEDRFATGAIGATAGSRQRMAPVDAVREVCLRPGFVDAVERGTKIAKKTSIATTAPVVVALIACELDNKPACDTFFHRLQTMEGLQPGAPEHSVDRALRSWKMKGSTLQRSAYGQLFALIRGYIASRDGVALGRIYVPQTPETFPYLPTRR